VPSCCAATEQGAGRDASCAHFPIGHHRKVIAMSRFVAPLSFTIAAAWVICLFVLVHSQP
jgi:hypothetical protein